VALKPNNLIDYVGDPLINLVVSGLFIVGGIGFVVVADMYNKRRFHDYSLHTKLMLVGTGDQSGRHADPAGSGIR
jgi:trk system potassium uptake protein TrkH